VVADAASASYEDGILRLEVPLADADEQVRQIRIQTRTEEQ
jgi:HSP20 family molecular chaperone IbpA